MFFLSVVLRLIRTSRENASLVLTEYLESIGGREKLFVDNAAAVKGKKRGRASTGGAAQNSKKPKKNGRHPLEDEPPATARAATWRPPAGSWEDHIAQLDACEDEDTGKLMVYLTWKNGHKTQHETSVIYQRCPQKVCTLCYPPTWPSELTYVTDASVLRATRPRHQERSSR